MLVRESTENAFGAPVKGVEIRLTADEARLIVKMLQQGTGHPPKARDGLNTDYDAVKLGGQLATELEKATGR